MTRFDTDLTLTEHIHSVTCHLPTCVKIKESLQRKNPGSLDMTEEKRKECMAMVDKHFSLGINVSLKRCLSNGSYVNR